MIPFNRWRVQQSIHTLYRLEIVLCNPCGKKRIYRKGRKERKITLPAIVRHRVHRLHDSTSIYLRHYTTASRTAGWTSRINRRTTIDTCNRHTANSAANGSINNRLRTRSRRNNHRTLRNRILRNRSNPRRCDRSNGSAEFVFERLDISGSLLLCKSGRHKRYRKQ